MQSNAQCHGGIVGRRPYLIGVRGCGVGSGREGARRGGGVGGGVLSPLVPAEVMDGRAAELPSPGRHAWRELTGD